MDYTKSPFCLSEADLAWVEKTFASMSQEEKLRQHRTIASVVFDGSFAPILQFEKLEIHTVFLRFSNFILKQNLSPKSLVELRGVALNQAFMDMCPRSS